MKYIITESQLLDSIIKRRLNLVSDLIMDKMNYYPPCDYEYEDGFFDYYSDVRNYVITTIINDNLGWDWGDDINRIDDLSNKLDNIIYPMFHDELKTFFDSTIEKGCDEE